VTEFSFSSRIDQWLIHAYHWPCQPNVGVIIISHGLGEHAQRYQRFAEALNDQGFEVYAMDHRAHGKTLGPAGFGDFGDGGWDALVDDIDQLIEIAQKQNPTSDVVLFGHSMGAAAAQQFAPMGSAKIAGLILSGSTLRDPGEEIPVYNKVFEPARTAYDWLSRDPKEVDIYIDDPLCGFEGQTIRNGMDRTDPRRVDATVLEQIRSDLPVLLVAGDADPVNNKLKGIDYLEKRWHEAGVSNITRQIYAGGRHEMLNETNRDEVTANMISWLQSVVSA